MTHQHFESDAKGPIKHKAGKMDFMFTWVFASFYHVGVRLRLFKIAPSDLVAAIPNRWKSVTAPKAVCEGFSNSCLISSSIQRYFRGTIVLDRASNERITEYYHR